jgi:site-specific recombinase XerD
MAQELLGHAGVTTKVYTSVLNRGGNQRKKLAEFLVLRIHE